MVTLTILYSLSENQSPNRSNGARGLLSPVWQGRRTLIACAPLVMSLPRAIDSAVPRRYSDDGGGERIGAQPRPVRYASKLACVQER